MDVQEGHGFKLLSSTLQMLEFSTVPMPQAECKRVVPIQCQVNILNWQLLNIIAVG